jgi:hypothetical protein
MSFEQVQKTHMYFEQKMVMLLLVQSKSFLQMMIQTVWC